MQLTKRNMPANARFSFGRDDELDDLGLGTV
eukprot:COSAG06_NODE_41409_length_391_cov_12.606164_1_plen_30_part_10